MFTGKRLERGVARVEQCCYQSLRSPNVDDFNWTAVFNQNAHVVGTNATIDGWTRTRNIDVMLFSLLVKHRRACKLRKRIAATLKRGGGGVLSVT